MPYLTLTLSGLLIDLPADAAVALSYRANDLRQLDSREAAFSEQFTLPLTARNVAALGAPHALDSQTLAPYRLLPAVLTSPGGTELLRGFGILEASGAGYEITLTDAVGGLFAQVGDRPLRTLDLSAHDHVYALDTTRAGQLRDHTQGYSYVLADDGRLTLRDVAKGLLWYELTQVVYYHAVLTAIVAAALPGYRLTGSLLDDPRYQKAVLPRATPTPRLRASTIAPYAIQALTTLSTREHDNGTGKYYPLIPFQQLLTGNAFFWNGTEFHTPPFPADIRISARLLVRLDAEFANVFSNAVAAVRIVDSTGPAATSIHEQVIFAGGGMPLVVAAQPVGLTALDFDFTLPGYAANRRFAVQLRLENGAGLTIGAGSTISFAIGPRVYPGAPVQLEASLPDKSRADFLKLLFNQFNAVMQADANTKTVRFDLFNDLEKRRDAAVDWSAKIDFQARPRLTYRLGNYAQRNTYDYAEAPSAYADMLLGAPKALPRGSGSLPVPNRTLPAVAEAYAAEVLLPLPHPAFKGAVSLSWLPQVSEVDAKHPAQPYGATLSYHGGDLAVFGGLAWRCILPGTDALPVFGTPPTLAPVGYYLNAQASLVYTAVCWEIAPYTVLNAELPTCALLVAAPFTPGLLVIADAPDATSFAPLQALSRTGLGFDVLLPAYHEGLRRALDPARVLTLPLRLTPLDIAELDFTRPVRFDVAHVPGYGQLKGLFYLNDIDQFLPGRPQAVPVTLLAMGDEVPGLAPPVTVPIYVPGAPRRALLLESGAPLLLESGFPITL